MSDMYGAVRSNWFRVRDPQAFKTWFEGHVTFGEATLTVEKDPEAGGPPGEPTSEGFRCVVAGLDQYPNAYPFIPAHEAEDDLDSDRDVEEWDLEAFATEMRKHLLPGEEFRVLAAGNEKLRYVAATHLIVTHEEAIFNSYCEGN